MGNSRNSQRPCDHQACIISAVQDTETGRGGSLSQPHASKPPWPNLLRSEPPRPKPVPPSTTVTEVGFATALKKLRMWAGLSQLSVAARHDSIGSDSTISACERGQRFPQWEFVRVFVTICLQHRNVVAHVITDELEQWDNVWGALNQERLKREAAASKPTADPAPTPIAEPGPATLATTTEGEEDAANETPPPTPVHEVNATTEDAAVDAVADDEAGADPIPGDATSPSVLANEQAPVVEPDEPPADDSHPDDSETPDSKPTEPRRRWRHLSKPQRYCGIGAAAAVVIVVLVLVGLAYRQGTGNATEAEQATSHGALTPAQPLVSSPPYVPGATYSQTVNSPGAARTYGAPYKMMDEGKRIDNHATVRVSCKIVAPSAGASTVGTYWYRIASPPWNDQFYSPTNSFLNDDPITGSHEKIVDEGVPYCPPPSQ
jgi:hypothetical protein